MINFGRLKAVAWKEFIHVFRDWRSLGLSIAIPALLILLFGYALNMDLDDVPTVIWDQSGTPESREFISLLGGSNYFSIENYYDNYRDIERDIQMGKSIIGLVIPYDFSSKILSGKNAEVQVIIDGSDANTAQLSLNYMEAIGFIYNNKITVREMQKRGGGSMSAPVAMNERAWYNADLKSTNVILPGIIALVMVVIAAMLTSVTVAKEWELGTMEQLISSPIRGPEIVLGKVIPYFTIGFFDVLLAVYLGRWLFHVPLKGNTALLFFMASIFLTGSLFFGMLLSVKLKTQVLANQVALMASYLPTLMLSGFVFSIANMPHAVQVVTYFFPARYFITILRGIYLKGVGLEIILFNAVLLSIYAAIMVIVANKNMKLKLE